MLITIVQVSQLESAKENQIFIIPVILISSAMKQTQKMKTPSVIYHILPPPLVTFERTVSDSGYSIQQNDINQNEDYSDYDDSVKDPDFEPEKEQIDTSSSEDEMTHLGKDSLNNVINLDHEEVVTDVPTNKGKSVVKGEENCVKKKNKRLRMEGKQYKGMTKKDGKWGFYVARNERILADRSCSKRCERSGVKKCSSITEDDRNSIFTMFWNRMTWEERKVYVNSLVATSEVGALTAGEYSRRNSSYKYFLRKNDERLCVSKSLCLSTLGIGEKTVYGWVDQANHGIPSTPFNEETDTRRSRKHVQFKKSTDLRDSVKTFLESLPKLESHYCRSSSSKLYLEPMFESMHCLYQEYKNQCAGNIVACRKLFNEVFSFMNLALYSPKKDQCDLCCSYKVGSVPEDVYERHQARKTAARTAKEIDKAYALDTKSTKVLTMDVQAVLLSPKLNASALYYKTKLACHNFTVYDLASRDVSCYFWPEGEGDLSANSFASCISHYIESIVATEKEAKHFILYSDGCGYQNRNSILSNALCHLSAKLNVTITQKYLEKGHTQMEVDSVHSAIERKIKKKNINVPQNYVEAMQQCRSTQPFIVNYVDHTFFKRYSDLNYYNSIRPGTKVGDPVVSNLRVISYTPDKNIQYKLCYDDQFVDLPRRARNSNAVFEEPKQLHDGPTAIKKSKYDHLQALKSVLPADYHSFYDVLKHN